MYLDDRDYRAPRGFNALFSPQTYKNILYLFLAFPLGLLYFIFYVVGFSLGFGLLVILVGIPILMMMIVATDNLARFERQLNRLLLSVEIEAPIEEERPNGWQGWLKTIFRPQWVMNAIYLGLKFPFGIVSLAMVTAMVGITFGMIFAPMALIFEGEITAGPPFLREGGVMGAFLIMGLGLLTAPLTLTLLNMLAEMWGNVSVRLLSPVNREERETIAPRKNEAKLKHDDLSAEQREDYFYRDSEILQRQITPPKMKNRFLKDEE